ncbi:hypothetical protein IMG5_098220 [Ichthyophthirius multifiliis]|uniref:DNA topoisomerase n=1 Tax=Ichthyophthirius multifiliis TaxID=5932 RepID=G0QRW6_ICHMU|nr:hypothetical protein IMG5_098220 [Ichthyophthirius multifiliis]EGR31996.1 hypothetical protein IMG5_098220 [Ichthyophthirius multifiliis]|eukprot:XP_004035482.1 hypothetical protein IMG5_098220 [Ichthyophthirius multifiliis]
MQRFKNIINVAEKPSVAKEVTKILSKGRHSNIQSESKFNPIYKFNYQLYQQPVNMLFTSVTGHIIQTKFDDKFKNWTQVNPQILLDPNTEILRFIAEDKKKIEENLKIISRDADTLILWLDCDREGEAIAYEVIDICQSINRNLQIKRAQFSSLDYQNINRAINNLREPKKELNDAVQARIEIDLRIGAAFTRFQTINLQNKFQSLKQSKEIISYGPCQFPTLGFVVERYNQIQLFKEEKFWYIQGSFTWNEGQQQYICDLKWERVRLYDQEVASLFYIQCTHDERNQFNPKGIVVKKIEKETKNKNLIHQLQLIQQNKVAHYQEWVLKKQCKQPNIYIRMAIQVIQGLKQINILLECQTIYQNSQYNYKKSHKIGDLLHLKSKKTFKDQNKEIKQMKPILRFTQLNLLKETNQSLKNGKYMNLQLVIILLHAVKMPQELKLKQIYYLIKRSLLFQDQRQNLVITQMYGFTKNGKIQLYLIS